VTLSSEADVIRTYGEPLRARCAYLLMYRKVGTPTVTIGEADIPKYLLDDLLMQKAEEEKEEARRKELQKKVTLEIFYNSDFRMFPVSKDDTLLTLKLLVNRFFSTSRPSSSLKLMPTRRTAAYECMRETGR
jgi:hypothetical protein